VSAWRPKSRNQSRLRGYILIPDGLFGMLTSTFSPIRITGTLLSKTSSRPLERGSRRRSTVCLQYLLQTLSELGSPGIGCAGELQLTPHDDYEKWAITILVKFRDTEQLQQLTAHRQSGGVRYSSSQSSQPVRQLTLLTLTICRSDL
jgi:hypothetical protein